MGGSTGGGIIGSGKGAPAQTGSFVSAAPRPTGFPVGGGAGASMGAGKGGSAPAGSDASRAPPAFLQRLLGPAGKSPSMLNLNDRPGTQVGTAADLAALGDLFGDSQDYGGGNGTGGAGVGNIKLAPVKQPVETSIAMPKPVPRPVYTPAPTGPKRATRGMVRKTSWDRSSR